MNFFLPLPVRAESGGNPPSNDWVCIFVLFVVWMRCPAQDATGSWVMLGLVCEWLPLWEFYLTLPRIRSSLVVEGLGVSTPTPKAQGSIFGWEWRFHKWFIMASNGIETNTQK